MFNRSYASTAVDEATEALEPFVKERVRSATGFLSWLFIRHVLPAIIRAVIEALSLSDKIEVTRLLQLARFSGGPEAERVYSRELPGGLVIRD